MVECLLHLLEASERLSRKRIESVIGSALETEREHMAQEQVIMRVNRHLVLVLMNVLDGVSCSRVAFKARHHELFHEVVKSDLFEEWRVEDAESIRLRFLLAKLTGLLDLLSNDLLYVLLLGSLQDFARPRVLGVLTATQGE